MKREYYPYDEVHWSRKGKLRYFLFSTLDDQRNECRLSLKEVLLRARCKWCNISQAIDGKNDDDRDYCEFLGCYSRPRLFFSLLTSVLMSMMKSWHVPGSCRRV